MPRGRDPTAPARHASARRSRAPAPSSSCRCPARRPASRRCRAPRTPRRLRNGAARVRPHRPTKTPRARRSSGFALESRLADFALGSTRERASSTSDAEAGRSSGAFSSSRRINASSSGGQRSLCHEGATGRVLMCWLITRSGRRRRRAGVPSPVRRASRRASRGPTSASLLRRAPARAACRRRSRSSSRAG